MISTLALCLCCTTILQAQTNRKSAQQQPFMFSAQAGWGYRFGNTDDGLPSGLKDHVDALRSGLALRIEAGYFIMHDNALTLTWDMFSSSNNSARFLTPGPNGQSVSSRVNTEDRINLYMANWLNYFRLGQQGKARVFGQVGIGLVSMRSENNFFFDEVSAPATLKGTGLAYGVGAGVDVKVAKNIALVGQANYIAASARPEADNMSLGDDVE